MNISTAGLTDTCTVVSAAQEHFRSAAKMVAPMTEAELLAEVLDLAEDFNVLAFHCYDSRYATGKGFPDLVLAGRNDILFAELKAYGGGRFTSDQIGWKYRLVACGGNYVYWTPAELESGLIERTLVSL